MADTTPEQAALDAAVAAAAVAPNSLGGWSTLQDALNRTLPWQIDQANANLRAIDAELVK